MAERGMRPAVPPLRRRALRGVRLLFTPLLPDDYLELIDPMWSTRELRGRVEWIDREADNAVTIHIKPAFEWQGHEPGQYLRLGVVVDGVHHWRAYSITSEPGDEFVSVTPKLVDGGKVTPYLVNGLRPGEVVRLGEVEGTFTAPSGADPLLFVTAGSGITPVISMLRHLEATGALRDVVHVHSARTADDVIFGAELDQLAERNDGLALHVWTSGERGRLTPAELAELCPDWRARQAYCSGPGELLDELAGHWKSDGDPDRFHLERFQPVVGGTDAGGSGGSIRFTRRRVDAQCPAGTPILVAGEEAGIDMPHGCRMGVCHTCVLRVRSGRTRDLRTGEVSEKHNEIVRTCVNAAEGPVEVEL